MLRDVPGVASEGAVNLRKLKWWLYKRFLPEWCRESLIGENIRLHDALREKNAEIAQLRAYIRGVHAAMRSRKIVIQTGGNAGVDFGSPRGQQSDSQH